GFLRPAERTAMLILGLDPLQRLRPTQQQHILLCESRLDQRAGSLLRHLRIINHAYKPVRALVEIIGGRRKQAFFVLGHHYSPHLSRRPPEWTASTHDLNVSALFST